MRSTAGRPVACVLALGLAIAVPASALAQRPHGTPPGLAKQGGQPPGQSSPGSSGSGGSTSSRSGSSKSAAVDVPAGGAGGGATTRVRSLGVWLDDATVMAPGEGWLTMSLQRWGSPTGTGVDAPIFDLAGGVGHHAQPFVSLPYSRVTYTGSPTEGELGTVYLGAKIGLRDPEEGTIGISVTPAFEILSESATVGTGLSRVNLVLPASLEWRQGATRVYGSTGYFTRGAFFVGGAVEQSFATRWVATGALTQAWSTSSDALSNEIGLRSSRTDLSGGLSWILSPEVMIFGSVARTLSPLDADATRYSFTTGASLNLSHPGRRTPIAKP